ncbi:MAG: hypothetical protein K2P57_13215, partial [Burkholderiales bacterium]|nr:hypothetical protein [Burkholderiales bacterium]
NPVFRDGIPRIPRDDNIAPFGMAVRDSASCRFTVSSRLPDSDPPQNRSECLKRDVVNEIAVDSFRPELNNDTQDFTDTHELCMAM